MKVVAIIELHLREEKESTIYEIVVGNPRPDKNRISINSDLFIQFEEALHSGQTSFTITRQFSISFTYDIIDYIYDDERMTPKVLPEYNIIENGTINPIYICISTRSYCYYKGCRTEMRKVFVEKSTYGGRTHIVAEYCFDCKEYKIDRLILGNYERAHGAFILLRYYEIMPGFWDKQEWRSESLLHRLGYHVGQTGMLESQRRRLLSYIIENGLMTPSDIIYTLRQNNYMDFDMHYHTRKKAMSDRNDDLQYLYAYVDDEYEHLGVIESSI